MWSSRFGKINTISDDSTDLYLAMTNKSYKYRLLVKHRLDPVHPPRIVHVCEPCLLQERFGFPGAAPLLSENHHGGVFVRWEF